MSEHQTDFCPECGRDLLRQKHDRDCERGVALRLGLDPDAFPPGTLLRDLGRSSGDKE